MHEAALVEDLRRRLVEIAKGAPGERIVRVRFRIGALSHLTGPLLQDRWPDLVHGTPAEGARLEVEVGTDELGPGARSVVLVEVGLEPSANG